MTDKDYIESLLLQNSDLQQDNLKIRRENSNLKKSNRHLKRVIKGYKEKLNKNNKMNR